MGCGLLNNFKFSKKFNFFYQNVLLGPDVYAVTDLIVKRDCEEDADEATGAESSIDEGDAGRKGGFSCMIALTKCNINITR